MRYFLFCFFFFFFFAQQHPFLYNFCMSARQPIRRSATLVRAANYRSHTCARSPFVHRHYGSASTKQRPAMAKIQRSMGGIFEPFLESATTTAKSKPEAPPFKPLSELTLKGNDKRKEGSPPPLFLRKKTKKRKKRRFASRQSIDVVYTA
ncbi:hypothetical protein BX666DRAFT_232515 [Dichotomocladium elegans]|nr:hypothetical protein BX666DRAFT_232515 [Dichotomocladium elegans]